MEDDPQYWNAPSQHYLFRRLLEGSRSADSINEILSRYRKRTCANCEAGNHCLLKIVHGLSTCHLHLYHRNTNILIDLLEKELMVRKIT